MWAAYKLEDGRRMWYCGLRGEWSSDPSRAARWPDKRDAQYISVYIRGYVDWLDHTANRTQVVSDTAA